MDAAEALKLRIAGKYVMDASTGCWLWSGRMSGSGYGSVRDGGRDSKQWQAHRAMWFVVYGPIPVGLCVCHKCDVPLCVNPGHLFLGTCADNVRDALAKGRLRPFGGSDFRPPISTIVRGEGHYKAKLTAKQVAAIRNDPGDSHELARQLGVTERTIYQIRTRKTWKHVS